MTDLSLVFISTLAQAHGTEDAHKHKNTKTTFLLFLSLC